MSDVFKYPDTNSSRAQIDFLNRKFKDNLNRQPSLTFEDKENSIEFEFGNDIDTTKTNERPKVIIVMNHPQEKDFTFEQPVNETVIVLQNNESDGFKIYPDNIDFNLKQIQIKKTDFRSFPYWTELSVELKWKNDFSVNGFQWMDR